MFRTRSGRAKEDRDSRKNQHEHEAEATALLQRPETTATSCNHSPSRNKEQRQYKIKEEQNPDKPRRTYQKARLGYPNIEVQKTVVVATELPEAKKAVGMRTQTAKANGTLAEAVCRG